MANRLIDELIINVRQRGAPQVERQLGRIVDTVEDAAVGAELLRNELSSLPRVLRDVEQAANRATSGLRGALTGNIGSDAVADSLSEISDALIELSGNSIRTNEVLDQLATDVVGAIDNMADRVTSDLERIEDQTEQTARGTRTLRNGFEEVGAAGRAAGEGANQHARGLANQNRQGRGSARTLSDLVNIAGPLVNAYAAVAANVFAVSEALRLLTEGAAIARLEQVGASIGANVGTPIANIAADIREASGGVLSYAESLRQASAAASFGFDSTQINDLTIVARRASIALGQDFTDALNRAIRGVSKLEVELLDELGITARLTTAYQRYAATIGVAADNLNAYQQRLALINEVTRQSELQLGFLDEQLGAVAWEEAAARARDAFDSIVVSISNATSGVAELVNEASRDTPEQVAVGRAEAIRAQLQEAQVQGSRAGIVGAFNEFELLERNLQEQIRQLETRAQQVGFEESRRLLNTINAYQAVIDGIRQEREVNFLGVEDVAEANAAYQGLNGAVRGAAADFTRLQASVRGNNTTTEALASNARDLLAAYDAVAAADPYANLTATAQSLGFENREAIVQQVELSDALRDATINAARFGAEQERIALAGQREGALASTTTVRTLEARLGVEQALLSSQESYGVNASQIARTEQQVLATTRQLEQARIAAVEAEFGDAAASRALFFRDINLGQVATLRQTITLEQARQQRLAELEGSQRAIEESRRRELDATLQIRDVENERIRAQQNAFLSQVGQQSGVGLNQEQLNQQDLAVAATSFNQALSQLTAQNPGLETMLTNLNAIAASFNNIGETSLNATQLTTVGLNAFAGLLQNASANAISAIDAQIAAERRRDGQSAESVARIRALEARKIREQRRAAQQSILISTAVAVMNAAANPWPVPALPLMAAAALAGGLALSQASSAASNQLASLNTTSTQQQASLTVGERNNRVDINSRASSGELAFIRGETGVGNINSFTPRQAGGIGTPGVGLLVGENGPEFVTPLEPVQVSDAEETEAMATPMRSAPNINLSVQALDAQSIIDRGQDIAFSVMNELRQQGIDLEVLR